MQYVSQNQGAFKLKGFPMEYNMWTHRVVAFGEVGKIGRTDLKEFQQELFLEKSTILLKSGDQPMQVGF